MHGMNGIGFFGCERRGDVLVVSGIEHPRHDIISWRTLRSGDELVLVRHRGHTGWAQVGSTQYYPTTFSIWRLAPIKGEWSFKCTLREQPRVKRAKFEGWYRIEETLREETPGRKRSVVKDMERQVIDTALRS